MAVGIHEHMDAAVYVGQVCDNAEGQLVRAAAVARRQITQLSQEYACCAIHNQINASQILWVHFSEFKRPTS